MAISPNDDFTAGQILTATECNNFPRGVMGIATSTTAYALTATDAIATGMTVTFTAVANRYYRITYFEPQMQMGTTPLAVATATIKQTNAAGTVLNSTISTTLGTDTIRVGMVCMTTNTFTAGSVTVVGCAKMSDTSGGPQMFRSATFIAFLLVEDIGLA